MANGMEDENDEDDGDAKLPPYATITMDNRGNNNNNNHSMGGGDYSDNIRTAQLIQALRLGQHNLSGSTLRGVATGAHENDDDDSDNNNDNDVRFTPSSAISKLAHLYPAKNVAPISTAASMHTTQEAEDAASDHNDEASLESASEEEEEEDEDQTEDMDNTLTSSGGNRDEAGIAAWTASQYPYETEEFKRPACAVFQKHNECKRTLACLTMGSGDEELTNVFQKFPFKDIPNSYRLYVPQQGDYVAEINRRSHFLAKENSPNDRRAIFQGISRGRHPRPKNWTVPKCREWLLDPAHYIGTLEDKTFLMETIAELKRRAQVQLLLGKKEEEEEEAAAENDSHSAADAAASIPAAAAASSTASTAACCDEMASAENHDYHHENIMAAVTHTTTMTTTATGSACSSCSATQPEGLESSAASYHEPMNRGALVVGSSSSMMSSSHHLGAGSSSAAASSPMGGEKRKAAVALEEIDKNISHQQHHDNNTAIMSPQHQQEQHIHHHHEPHQRVMNKAALQKDLLSLREIVASHDDQLQRQKDETAALRQELVDQKAQTAALQQQVTRMEQILDYHRLSAGGTT